MKEQQFSNLPVKGINTDILEKFQPEGTYRHALNATVETSEGDLQGISNELGNTLCASNFPSNKIIIGHVLTEDGRFVLFLFDPDEARPFHEIGFYNPSSCVYETIAKGACLNFSAEHQINALYRLKNGCTGLVYFTDNYNPYRVINITDTSDWVYSGSNLIKDCAKILFSRSYNEPVIDIVESLGTSGGSLPYGVYSFAFRYIDYDGNPTDWSRLTRYVPVGSGQPESLSSSITYHSFTGASNNPESSYYKAESGKAIQLSFSSLSTDFTKYQIAVVKRTTDSGAISSVDILSTVDITSSTSSYLYTGAASQVISQTSLAELLSETVKPNKVKAHTQDKNRLFIGNVSLTTPDYTGFQRHASSIKVEWEQSQTGFLANLEKTSFHYSKEDSGSFPHDEVLGLGIIYIFDDNSIYPKESPAFHIPGRAPVTTALTGSNNAYIPPSDPNPFDTHLVDLGDPNLIDSSQRERWKNYNTYTKYGSSRSGLMGYYETSTTYGSMNAPCDTHPDGYWGRDWQGNLITSSTKIRHHRTPLPIASLDFAVAAHKLGLKFTLTQEYPHPDIIGHKYVVTDRTTERTVLDSGLLQNMLIYQNNEEVEDALGSYHLTRISAFEPVASANTNSDCVYLSNSLVFDSKFFEGVYLRFVKVYDWAEAYLQYGASCSSPLVSTTIPGIELSGKHEDMYLRNFGIPQEFNFKPTFSAELPPSASEYNPSFVSIPGGFLVENKSTALKFGVFKLNRVHPDILESGTNGPFQVFIKSNAEVYTDLTNIVYRIATPKIQVKSSGSPLVSTTYNGDVFVNFVNYSDTVLKDIGSDEYELRVNSLSYDAEHQINGAFRSDGKDEYTVWKPSYTQNCPLALGFALAKVKKEGDVVSYKKEEYELNRSYNYQLPDNLYYPLSRSHKFCSDCNDEDFPYRIYYSEQETQESSQDLYRVIRPNNYRDLEGYTGPINDLVSWRDNLYVLTTNSPYFLPINPQKLSTEDINIYVGTGEVLGIPPRQLKTTEYAFGGEQHFKSRSVTEYGIFYMDEISARPFILSENLADISLNGMRNFFQEKGQLELREQIKELTSHSYAHTSTSSPIGIGYISTYDPRHKRIILHKKDYRILDAHTYKFQYSPTTSVSTSGAFWYDGQSFYFNHSEGSSTPVELGDPEYFENKSFTISYSFLTSSWISFHSYLPYYMFNDHSTFFSNGIYKHNEGNFQTYYGEKYDFILDYINSLNHSEIKTFSYAAFRTRTCKNTKDSPAAYSTFYKAIAYNSKQSSGYVHLIDPPFSSDYGHPFSNLKYVDNQYRLSGLRDIVKDPHEKIWTTDWNYLFSSPYSYQDRVPNFANLNYNKSLFETPRLKDYFLGLRLFYKPNTDDKITIDISTVNYSNRNR